MGLIVGFATLLIGALTFAGGCFRKAVLSEREEAKWKDAVDTGLVLVMISLMIIAGSIVWYAFGLALSGRI